MRRHLTRAQARFIIFVTVAALVPLFLILLSTTPVYAGGVVTNCSSAADLTSKLSGGGTVTFNCGSNPSPIVFSATIVITQNTTINGADVITLSGGNSRRLFVINSGVTLTLTHLSVVKGYANDNGGAIYNGGTLIIDNSKFFENQTSSDWSGGAIVSYGPLKITNSEFARNVAGNGGAVYPRFANAITTISGSSFHDNMTSNMTNGWGGAMLLWDGAVVTISTSNFYSNTALNAGGAIYSFGPSSLTISGTQFSTNHATATFAEGGAIYNSDSLSITNTTFTQNNASRAGGIFLASGTASIARSTFIGNFGSYGGALRQVGGDVFVTDTIFNHNGYYYNGSQVTTDGGALSKDGGNATLTNVTMSDNWASYGGAIGHSNGNTSLTNVTLSGNASVGGGGIYIDNSAITLTNVTLNNNSALFNGGGIWSQAGTLLLRNTIVANSVNNNCYGLVPSSIFSLSSDDTCGFGAGRDNKTMLLGPLAKNGGFAPTHLPLAGSPAIDNGSGIGSYCPATDQRGVTRPKGAACDVGAVEYRAGDTTPQLYVPLVLK